MAEQQNEVVVEDMATTPVQPVQEPVVAPVEEPVVAPVEQPVEDQQIAIQPEQPVVEEVAPEQPPQDSVNLGLPEPVDPDQVLAEAPPQPVAEEPVGEAVATGPSALKQFGSMQGPLVLPRSVKDRIADGTLTSQEEIQAAIKEMGGLYWNGVFRKGDDEADNAREKAIMNARGFAIPTIGEDGREVLNSEEGAATAYKYVPGTVKTFPPNFSLEQRLAYMVETFDNKSGIYHFFGEDGPMNPNIIDTGYRNMMKEDQNPVVAFFSRIESEKGGMANYEELLKLSGMKDSQRRTYQMRQQALYGAPFGAIERQRIGSQFQDTASFVGNLVTHTPPVVADITASIPMYWLQAMGKINNLFAEEKVPFGDEGVIEKSRDELAKIIAGDAYDPIEFEYVADSLSKDLGLPLEQVEQLLTYSPDLLTQASRLLAETAVTGTTVLGASRYLAMRQSQKLSDYIMETATGRLADDGFATQLGKYDRGFKPTKLEDAIQILEDTGMDTNTIIKKFVDERGGGKLSRAFLADGLDFDAQTRAMLPGPFRQKLLGPQITKRNTELTDVEEKLELAIQNKRKPEYIASLRTKRDKLRTQLKELREDTLFPPKVKQFLKDEGIATGAYATTYQLLYNYGPEGDDMTSSLGGALGAILTTLPGVRRSAGATWEDIMIGLTSSGEETKIRKAAAKVRRHVEKAPPELQEQILGFAEYRAELNERMASFIFPEGHPRAGQRVFSPSAFDEAFFEMSGLLSMQHLKKTQLGDTVDIQSDAGKLSKGLADIEATLAQQQVKHQSMAEMFDSLRFYVYSDSYDPKNDADRMLGTLVESYDRMGTSLTKEMTEMNQILDDRENLLMTFLSGNLTSDEMGEILLDEKSLYDLIETDKIRYIRAFRTGVEADGQLRTDAEIIQEYYVDLQRRVTEASDRAVRYNFDPEGKQVTTNKNFLNFVNRREKQEYDSVSAMFNDLRDNPEFRGARIDMTDIFDQMLLRGGEEDQIFFDARALINVTGVQEEGTQASRYLAKLNLDARLNKGVGAIFNTSAREYMNQVEEVLGADTVAKIFEEADLPEGASPIDQFIELRRHIQDNYKGLMDPEDYARIEPRLGLDPTSFMHLTSSIGATAAEKAAGFKPGARTAAILREELLAQAETGFFLDFYNPAAKQTLDGWSDAYSAARTAYKQRYIKPFRQMSPRIKAIVRSDEDLPMPEAFNRFLTEMGVKPDANAADLREGVNNALELLTGGKPLDVTTPEGKEIRNLFTMYVQEELARTAGSGKLRELLLGIRRDGTSVLPSTMIVPEQAEEIERALRQGTTATTSGRLELFLKPDGRGNFMFRDVNGQPIIDPAVADSIDFDAGMVVDKRFRDALIEFKRGLEEDARKLREAMDDFTTKEGQEIATRKNFVERFKGYSGGIGEGIVEETLKEGGLRRISQMREDYVAEQVARGVDRQVAIDAFDQVKEQAVIDYLFSKVTKAGAQRAYREIDEETGEVISVVQQGTQIDANSLLQVLGLNGDRVSRTRQETLIRELLGNETYEHLQMIGTDLFTVDVKTGDINVKGIALPLSAESLLSRGTSFMRGVISMRWLISEAAIRNARLNNLELTKMMLFNPKVGREVLKMIKAKDFKMDSEAEWVRVLISQMAKNQALQQYEADQQEPQQNQQPAAVDAQMQNLIPQGA